MYILIKYIGLAFMVVSCTSCFTKGLVKNAFTIQYADQKADSVKDAYLLDGQLIINFVQLIGNTGEKNWHIAIPVDSLLQWHKAGEGYQTLLPKDKISQYKALEVYTVLPPTPEYRDFGKGVVAEMHYSAIKKKAPRRPTGASPAKVYLLRHNTHFVYSPFRSPPDRSNKAEKKIPDRQNILFLYYPDKDKPDRPPLGYIAISIEPKKRMHAEWMLALPVTILLDVVTGPVQMLLGL